MTGDINSGQTVYNSSDIASLLKIQDSTLRKYALMLEEAGYKFHKNEHGQRGFFEKDVIILKKLIQIKKRPDMTLKQACNALMTTVNTESVSVSDTSDIALQNRDNIMAEFQEIVSNEIKKALHDQQEFNQKLLHEFRKQSEQINRLVDIVSQDQKLFNQSKEVLDSIIDDNKKAEIEAAAAEQTEKKGFWRRLLGK
jgi:DNA-binding transcriptional MerR regulator